MRITADREKCVGAAQCVLSDPEVFDQNDEDGRVELLLDQPGPDRIDEVRRAVDLCPSQALRLREG